MIDVWAQNWSDHFYRKILGHYLKLQDFYKMKWQSTIYLSVPAPLLLNVKDGSIQRTQLFYALLFCLANWPYILLAIPMSIMSDGPTPPSRFPR